jgi:tetratricopeptide (TPR) repeat protein
MLTAMLDSKHRGRRKGIPIRDGSVRQARLDANLSLAQVAADQVSRAAVHHIENGRSKPSIETLRLIARQTRKPIEYFLLAPDAHPELTHAHDDLHKLERLTSARDFEAVVSLGLSLLEKGWNHEGAAFVHLYLGQAYCRLVQPAEALMHLPLARAYFERYANEWSAVDALDWEASAWELMEDARAIGLANQALERCRKFEPRPQQMEARILGHLAGMYVVALSWALAISHYEAAAEAASAVKDLLQLAKMHHGLGVTYSQLERPTLAREHFEKALALYSIESDLSAVYRVENDIGHLLMQQGQLDSAEQHFLKALAGAEELHMDRRGRGFVLVNLGEVNFRKGRLSEAREYLGRAAEVGQAVGERIVLADAHCVLGLLEERTGNLQAADEQFGEAIQVLEQLESSNRLRDCHMDYAQVLEDRGDVVAAMQHWKAAAGIGKAAALGAAAYRKDEARRLESGRSVS